jgi:hypothetical protein
MSSIEIIAQLPKLTHKERRAVARRIIELEGEAQLLADCDRRADANFKTLDVMEAEDDGSSRVSWGGLIKTVAEKPLGLSF